MSTAPLREVTRLFLRLGFTAFGGPAAHIAMMRDEVVVRRRWMEEQPFLDLVGATNLIPGPNSTEMAIHIGYLRAGWRGLIAAGLCFILPAVAITLILAWAYVAYGSTPQGSAILYGVQPVIIAIVGQALWGLRRAALKSWPMVAAALATFALYLLGMNELVLLFGGALLVMGIRLLPQLSNRGGRAMGVLAPVLALYTALPTYTDRAAATAVIPLGGLFLVFLKVGALLYGSGYVLLAFLRNDLVVQLGWLTDQQLLDAISIGQFTPGPVFSTATFIGYVLAGVPGAIVATIGIFLPSFLFVALLARIVPHIRKRTWTAAFLDGVNVAAFGLMAGVTAQLARAALVDIPTILLACVGAFLLLYFRLNSAWLVLLGALAGLALHYVA